METHSSPFLWTWHKSSPAADPFPSILKVSPQNFPPLITNFLPVKSHLLISPFTNPCPIAAHNCQFTSIIGMPCQIPSLWAITIYFFKRHNLFKIPLKPIGRVSSYLHLWHSLGQLPRQGCPANLCTMARDSVKALIRDKLNSCIPLQNHFLNCLLEGDLSRKSLSSPARSRDPYLPLAAPHQLLSL